MSPFRKAKVLDIIIDWHRRNQLQDETIAYNLDRIYWLLENPDRDYEDYDDLTADDFSAETRSEGFEYLDSESDDSEDYGVGQLGCENMGRKKSVNPAIIDLESDEMCLVCGVRPVEV